MITRIFKLIIGALFLAFIGAGVYFIFSPSGPWGITENKEDVEIIIPQGAGVSQIADILQKEKVISHIYGFLLRTLFMDKMKLLKAGEYLVPAQEKIAALIFKISSGDIIHRSFSVIEGATVFEVSEKLRDNKLLSGDIDRMPQEGRLLPATYPYHRGELRQALLDRMEKAMEMTLLALWENRPNDCLFKTPDEALTLASIIEKETSLKLTEQPRVAGVFVNRMKKNMRLQSDPTVIYGITRGQKNLGRSLTKSDLNYDSFYNTYLYLGLPPGPIACPRKEAIYAALHPNEHDEFYFVADGTGGHNFSKTLDEHNKNVKKWRALLQSQKKTEE